MYKDNKICVVVPAFNEEKHITQVISTMPSLIDQIIIIDDASSDDTYKLALNSNDQRVIVTKHENNQGVGGAIITGHKKAIELGYDISVVMAGDAQMDPKYLPKLLDPLINGGYHYTKGNRFMGKNSLKGMPKLRIIGNMLLTFLTKLSSGYWNIFDPQNGYTAIKLNIFEELDIGELAKRYEFENSMLLHLNIGNFRVKDVSIPAVYNDEESKIKLYKFIPRTSLFLLNGFLYRLYQKYTLRNFHPIVIFLFFGFLLFGIGSLAGIILIYLYVQQHIISGKVVSMLPAMSAGTVELSVLPLILGLQLILTGIILDVYETPK